MREFAAVLAATSGLERGRAGCGVGLVAQPGGDPEGPPEDGSVQGVDLSGFQGARRKSPGLDTVKIQVLRADLMQSPLDGHPGQSEFGQRVPSQDVGRVRRRLTQEQAEKVNRVGVGEVVDVVEENQQMHADRRGGHGSRARFDARNAIRSLGAEDPGRSQAECLNDDSREIADRTAVGRCQRDGHRPDHAASG